MYWRRYYPRVFTYVSLWIHIVATTVQIASQRVRFWHLSMCTGSELIKSRAVLTPPNVNSFFGL